MSEALMYNFPEVHYSSQSATSCYRECKRRYLFNYKLYGRGIVPTEAHIPLTTGDVIHQGVAEIIRQSMQIKKVDIDKVVNYAKECYAEIVRKSKLKGTPQQEYTFNEQQALTEALLRLWYKKEFPVIVEFYDILATEQEIVIPLDEFGCYQSRPDLILIHKKNRDIVNYSLKTIKRVTDRLDNSYKVQLQAFTEPYCTNEWLKSIGSAISNTTKALGILPMSEENRDRLLKFYRKFEELKTSSSTATRFCYLIKGDWKEETKGDGFFKQDNPLIYGYRNFGPKEIRYAWSWYTPKPENKSGWGILGKGWDRFSIWDDPEVGGIKGWMEIIEKGEKIQGDLGDGHVFDKYILSKPEAYHSPNMIQSKMRQVLSLESDIITALKHIQNSTVSDVESVIDYHFDMNDASCYFPQPCDYLPICPNGNDSYREYIAKDPLNPEYGPMYRLREPHHREEAAYVGKLIQINGIRSND